MIQGCRSPLVVKLADSQKEKEMKRLQQMQAQLLNGAGAVGLGALGQQYLAVSHELLSVFAFLLLAAVIIYLAYAD